MHDARPARAMNEVYMVSVRLQNLSRSFGQVKAVDSVSLEVQKGELFFLLGPSGCGKTTVLRMIAGFYSPDSGDISFDGRTVNEVPPHRRNTGMVFQNYALWPHMTVEKNVGYGLDIRRVPSAEKAGKIRKVLETVRMLEYAQRKPAQLSGGQQQRVALARALVIEPDLLLLDEPLSNLDAKLRLEMRGEIKRIHGETGITSIYVTHDQKEALSMADRIAVMNAGKIEQVGSPRELYENPADRFVAGFIGETNFIEGKVTGTQDDRVTVETPIGIIIAQIPNKLGHPSRTSSGAHPQQVGAPNSAVQPGDAVVCSIRPEAVDVLDEKGGGTENGFECTVESFMYLGDNEQYQIRMKDGGTMKAVAHNPWGKMRKNGSIAWIRIEPSNVILLKK